MDSKARVDVNFVRVNVNFQTVIVTYFCYSIFFFHFDITDHQGPTNTTYKISAIYTLPFWRKCDFNGFAIFSIGGHYGFSTRMTFRGLKPCSPFMQHVKFEIHRCSGFREKII